jgi:hypothetical protein
VTFDFLIGVAMNSRTRRITIAAVAVGALTAGLTACGGDSLESGGSGKSSGGGKGKLVVGAAGFTEAKVLGELYKQVLGNAGYSVTVKTVENREIYEPQLEKGAIDIVPEYAATLAEFLNLKENGSNAKAVASSDVDATVTALKKLAEPKGLKVLPAGDAVDQNAFAVSSEFAKKRAASRPFRISGSRASRSRPRPAANARRGPRARRVRRRGRESISPESPPRLSVRRSPAGGQERHGPRMILWNSTGTSTPSPRRRRMSPRGIRSRRSICSRGV